MPRHACSQSPHRRRALTWFAAFGLTLLAGSAQAQEPASKAVWPPRSVRLIVPFSAGSTPDLVGRVLADSLAARHPGTTIIVENKPGASGNIGTDAVAKAAPDGATIGISLGGPLAINTLLFSRLPYDPLKDIAPVSLLTRLPNVLAVPASLGVTTVSEFISKLKADPKGFNYGSIGAGSLSQICMEAIAQAAGASMVNVPYPGSPAAVTALIRGDVQAVCLASIAVTPQLATGAVRILAVSTAERSPFLPDVPTLKESGIDVESDAWNALIAPGGTPPAIVAAINAEVATSLAEPTVIEKLKVQQIAPAPSTPQALSQLMADEKRRWADVIKKAQIRID
jgi:tripartite-type tricarboxylate transporter receptor subunit TctC